MIYDNPDSTLGVFGVSGVCRRAIHFDISSLTARRENQHVPARVGCSDPGVLGILLQLGLS